jgi:hypothetical protein
VTTSKQAKSQTLMTAVRQAVVQEAQALFSHLAESFAEGYNRASKRSSAAIVPARKKPVSKARASATKPAVKTTSPITENPQPPNPERELARHGDSVTPIDSRSIGGELGS